MHSEHSDGFADLCVLYYARELKGPEQARFEAHKKGCAACRDLLQALEGAGRAAGAAAHSLSAGRLERMAGKVLETDAEARWRPSDNGAPPALKRVWGFCTVLAALALGLYISSPGRFPETEAPRTASLDSDIASLSEEIGRLSAAIDLGGDGAELEADIQALEDVTDRMRRLGSGA
jgi:hypothetical protein